MRFIKPVKIDGKTVTEIREELKLPPIHTSEDVIYLMTVKMDQVNFVVEKYIPDFKNIKAYKDKWNEVISDSPEEKFLADQLCWHENCLEDINNELYPGIKFYTTFDGEIGDIRFYKLTNLELKVSQDYFGEIDVELDYRSAEINKEDIPEEILKQFEEEYDLEQEK